MTWCVREPLAVRAQSGGGPPVCWCRPPLPGLLLAFAFEHGLDPGEPCTEDLYKVTPSSLGIETLPANLGQAIDAFDSDPLAAAVLGPELKDAYAALKRDEWAAAQHHVPEWDRERYLELF